MATASSVDETFFRDDTFSSLGIMPALFAFGHLAPAFGGSRAAVGRHFFDLKCFAMMWSITTIVDAYDKYKDMPISTRPRKIIWRSWMGFLALTSVWSTYLCGLDAAIRLHRFLGIGLLWGTPCIPTYVAGKGLKFSKPKRLFGEAKSLVVALCMGPVDADTVQAHACTLYPHLCAPMSIHLRSLGFAILYNWVRETICDVRDISEDTKEQLRTLPITLGRNNTLALVVAVTLVSDASLSQRLDLEVLSRVTITMVTLLTIVQQPRENGAAWGFMALFGLVPAFWAQVQL